MEKKLVQTEETRTRTVTRNGRKVEVYERKYVIVKFHKGKKLPVNEEDFVWKPFDMNPDRFPKYPYQRVIENYERIKNHKGILYKI